MLILNGLVKCHRVREDVDGNFRIQPAVVSAVDLAHSTRSQR
jgi:hypothetical protein